MMFRMAGNDVCRGSRRHLFLIRDSSATPRVRSKVAELQDTRAADGFEFRNDFSERDICVICVLRPNVLIESGQRYGVVTGKHKASIREDLLTIDDVTDQLFDAPLAWFIPEAGLRFVNAAQKRHGRAKLLLEKT